MSGKQNLYSIPLRDKSEAEFGSPSFDRERMQRAKYALRAFCRNSYHHCKNFEFAFLLVFVFCQKGGCVIALFMHLRSSIWACFQYLWYFMSRGIWSSFYRGMEPRRAKTWLMWGCSGIHHRWEGCPRQAQLRPEPWRAARMHLCWPRQQFFPTFVDFTIETSLSTSPSRLLCRHHHESALTSPEKSQRNIAVRISKGQDLCQGVFSWPESVCPLERQNVTLTTKKENTGRQTA